MQKIALLAALAFFGCSSHKIKVEYVPINISISNNVEHSLSLKVIMQDSRYPLQNLGMILPCETTVRSITVPIRYSESRYDITGPVYRSPIYPTQVWLEATTALAGGIAKSQQIPMDLGLYYGGGTPVRIEQYYFNVFSPNYEQLIKSCDGS